MNLIPKSWRFFKLKGGSRAAARQGPAGSSLANDYSVDGVISWFERYQYVDDLLLRAGLSVDDLEKLLDDDEIASAWEKRTLAVEQKPWGLSDPESEISVFVWSQLKPHLSALTGELMRSVLYGMSCPQITYKQIGGKWCIAHYTPHMTSAFTVDKTGAVFVRINGVEFRIDETEELRLKFFPVIHRRTAKKPAGTALLSSLYWVALLRANTWEFWARFLERFGSPLLLGKAALGFTAEGTPSIEAMAKMLSGAVNSGVAVVANDEDVSAIGSNGNGEAFNSAQNKINERIQRRILGQTLTSGTTGVGSQALGAIHNDVRNEIVAADVALILPALQKIVDALVEINYPGKVAPTLTIESGATLSKDRADRDKVLYDTGVRFTEDYYIRTYDIEKTDIKEVTSGTQAAMLQADKGRTLATTQRFKLSAAGQAWVESGQRELDALADSAIRAAGEPVDYEALKAVVLSAKNEDDLVEKLAAWYETTHPETSYVEALGSLMFAADILGYEQADKGLDGE